MTLDYQRMRNESEEEKQTRDDLPWYNMIYVSQRKKKQVVDQ
jgi:hypothetical protein